MKNISKTVSLILLFTVLILSVACQDETGNEIKAEYKNDTEADTHFLPPPNTEGTISVEEALYTRRSRRNFQDIALDIGQLSQILWSAYGITDGNRLRTSPSAGALYPLEIYVVIGNVADIEPGVYKYDSDEHKIIKTIDGDIREELSAAALNQKMVNEAPITVVYIAVFDRITEKYGERGRERYVFMEIGHSAQNIYLQAEALGLGTCAIGAFTDDSVSQLLDLPEDEVPLYMMAVGYYKPVELSQVQEITHAIEELSVSPNELKIPIKGKKSKDTATVLILI